MGLRPSRGRNQRTYRSYLLQLWREPHSRRWLVIIQEPSSEERRAFSSLGSFINFLESFADL